MEKSEKCPASSQLQPILLILCVSPLPQCRPFGRKEMEKTADRRTSTGQHQLCDACPKAFPQDLLSFILLQLGQPAAKGHIQSLLMCCGRQVRPVCSRPATSPSSSRFSMCRFSPIHFRMNVAFGLFSRGSSLHS